MEIFGVLHYEVSKSPAEHWAGDRVLAELAGSGNVKILEAP